MKREISITQPEYLTEDWPGKYDVFSCRRSMNTLAQMGLLLSDIPIYIVNGALVVIYWLQGNAPALVSAACAALVAFLPDAEVQQRAGFRPGRAEREASTAVPRTAQIITGLVAVIWLVAQWGMGEPVPWLGAAM